MGKKYWTPACKDAFAATRLVLLSSQGAGTEFEMKKLLLACTVLCGMSGYALAADAVIVETAPEPVVVPVFSWTGAYVGGQVGYLWGDAEMSDPLFGDTSQPDADDWLGGIYGGFNYQMTNNVVLGGELDFAWTGADAFAPWEPSLAGGTNIELDWEGALRGRLGYAVDRFLPYIAGGVAFGRVTVESIDPTGFPLASSHDTLTGWTIGAGLDYAFTDNLQFRAEYRYTDFGDGDFTLDGTGRTGSGDLKTNDVRFGIAYKF